MSFERRSKFSKKKLLDIHSYFTKRSNGILREPMKTRADENARVMQLNHPGDPRRKKSLQMQWLCLIETFSKIVQLIFAAI